MKKRAFIKADINDASQSGYEIDIQAGGDLYMLVTLLHEILCEISGEANVSVEKLVAAAAADTQEVFEKDYSELFTEYLKGRNKDEIKTETE